MYKIFADRLTARPTDQPTNRLIPVYPPNLFFGGTKSFISTALHSITMNFVFKNNV